MSNNLYDRLDNYGIRHFPRHLAEAGEFDRLFNLMNAEFAKVLRARTKSDLLFTSHLALSREKAFELGVNGLAESFRMLFQEVGVRREADSIWPTTLKLMVYVGDIEKALDLSELIQRRIIKSVALVLLLRAFSDSLNPVNASHVDRIREMASPLFDGEEGIVILVALAEAYCLVNRKNQACKSLDLATSIATQQLVEPRLPLHLAAISRGYLQTGEPQKALDIVGLDRIRANTIPITLSILKDAQCRKDEEVAKRAIRVAAGIPDWLNSSGYGFVPEDLLELSFEAQALEMLDYCKKLQEKALGVSGSGVTKFCTEAILANKINDEDNVHRLLNEAISKASKEFSFFKAEAWLQIAKTAHKLGYRDILDESLKKCDAAMMEEDLWRINDSLIELARLYTEIGSPENGAKSIEKNLQRGVDQYNKEVWFELALLWAELDVSLRISRLKEVDRVFRELKAPLDFQSELGCSFARAGDYMESRIILERIEKAENSNLMDFAKAILQDSLNDEQTTNVKSRQDVFTLIGISQDNSFPNESEVSIASLEWVALKQLRRHFESNYDIERTRKEIISTLIVYPDPSNRDPDDLLNEVVTEQEGMGDTIGNIGLQSAYRLAQCVQNFIAGDNFLSAMIAIRRIEYWRMQTFMRVAPMDSSEWDTPQALFDTGRVHGGCLISLAKGISESAAKDSIGIMLEVLGDLHRIPHASVRFATLSGIALALCKHHPDVLLQLTRRLTEDTINQSREEFLGAIAAWLPVLVRIDTNELLASIYNHLPLAGAPTLEPNLPNVLPKSLKGAQFRTFELARSM